MKTKCRYKHSVLNTSLLYVIIAFYIIQKVWSDQLVHLHITTGSLQRYANKIPVIPTNSSSFGLHCCENGFVWPSKQCWTVGTVSSLHLPVRTDCGAVAWLLLLLELLFPAERPTRPAAPTPLQVPLPVLPSGLHNTDGRNIGQRTEDLESIRAVRVMDTGHTRCF